MCKGSKTTLHKLRQLEDNYSPCLRSLAGLGVEFFQFSLARLAGLSHVKLSIQAEQISTLAGQHQGNVAFVKTEKKKENRTAALW